MLNLIEISDFLVFNFNNCGEKMDNQTNELLNRIENAFPTAQHLKGPRAEQPDEKIWSFEGSWLLFKTDQLSEDSLKLLQALSDQHYATSNPLNHWYQFLTHQTQLPPDLEDPTQHVRLIQCRLTYRDHDDMDRRELTEALVNLFNQVVTHFYINPTTMIIVQTNGSGSSSLSMSELQSILQTMESDFFVKVQLFLGNFWPVNEELALIFNEEQAVFAKSTLSVSSLASLALDYYARPQLQRSVLAKQLNQLLNQDDDIKDVIIALYQNVGNLSSTAKQLFLHRNTLQYRLDRFHEATNLNLKNMDDLVLCYLLITSFND